MVSVTNCHLNIYHRHIELAKAAAAMQLQYLLCNIAKFQHRISKKKITDISIVLLHVTCVEYFTAGALNMLRSVHKMNCVNQAKVLEIAVLSSAKGGF